MNPVRVALVGCGEVADRHHLPLLARATGAVLTMLVDADPARRRAAARYAPGATLLADLDQALIHDDVDAVVLCLPSALHAGAALAALGSRKHVYVEKPLATSLPDASRVQASWRHAAVVGMMGFNYRFNRLYQNARRQLAEGRIGEPIAARSLFSTAERRLPEWKRTRPGGGALLDLGSHHFDLTRFLFDDRIVDVQADIRSTRSADDTAAVQVRLAGGLLVQSLFAFGTADEERFEIHGREGTLIVDRSRYQDVHVERPGRRWRRLGPAIDTLRQLAHVPYVLEKRLVPGHEPSHRTALRRFIAACAGSDSPVTPDIDDGYACAGIVDAAERSARERRSVAPAVDDAAPAVEAARA